MKYLQLALLFASTVIAGLTRKTSEQAVLGHSPETKYQYLIELEPGDTRWIAEEEKWALKRVRSCGMYLSENLVSIKGLYSERQASTSWILRILVISGS